jgi:hypothetical protein
LETHVLVEILESYGRRGNHGYPRSVNAIARVADIHLDGAF